MYKRELIIKWTAYGLAFFVVFVIQAVFGDSLRIFGIAPGLLPAAVSVVAVFEGAYAGAVFGLVSGLLYDAAVYGTNGFLPIITMIAGIVVGGVSDYIFKKNLLTVMLWALATLASLNLLFFLFFFLLTGKAGPLALLTTTLPEIAYSLALTPVLYALFRAINIKTNKA